MAKNYDLRVKTGDVFAGPLPDGRFGAVHVVKRIKDGKRPGLDSAFLVCTRFIGNQPPHIDDPTLRQVLLQNRFFFKNDPAYMITHDPPPPEFVHVGNFPPTSEEEDISSKGRFGSSWAVVEDVWMEWRWEHEREAFRTVVDAEREGRQAMVRKELGPRSRTKGSSLSEDQFWEMVGTVDTKRGDTKEAVAPLILVLSRRSPEDIIEFEEIIAEKLYGLDGRKYAEKADSSDDGFLYGRCYVVARGRKFYERVLRAPDEFPEECELEFLLSAAREAYLLRTGDDLEQATHYSYETGSNQSGWPT
jgi:hypothetical protein